MKSITFLPHDLITLEVMLFIAALDRIFTPRQPEANHLLAVPRAALGHLGLIVIALVFVLIAFWKS